MLLFAPSLQKGWNPAFRTLPWVVAEEGKDPGLQKAFASHAVHVFVIAFGALHVSGFLAR
jgi:hypothetical protein